MAAGSKFILESRVNILMKNGCRIPVSNEGAGKGGGGEEGGGRRSNLQ